MHAREQASLERRIGRKSLAARENSNLQLTILERIYLFDQYFAHAFLPLVDIVLSYRIDDQLLQLREFTHSLRRNLVGHLLVIVLQLANLL